jgi:hypothetical protein
MAGSMGDRRSSRGSLVVVVVVMVVLERWGTAGSGWY